MYALQKSHFLSKNLYILKVTALKVSFAAKESLLPHTQQLRHQKTHRNLKSSSFSPKLFCTFLQSS